MIFYRKIAIHSNETKCLREQRLHQEAWRFLGEILERQYGMPTNSESFARDDFGKPYLIHYPQVHFNISHCEEMVSCVVGTTQVGIDIERIRPFPNGVMKKVCSLQEQESIHLAVNAQKQFFKLWTLKESYIKAVGKGLQLPMKCVVFNYTEDGRIESNQEDYVFRQIVMDEQYIVSVCERR